MLAREIDEQHYWQVLYHQPVDYWKPALERIRERHGLPPGPWVRYALGKNAVFALGALVVKLGPPFWRLDLLSEAEVLRFVYNRLPVATPQLLADGELDGWTYMVQSRLPGELLRSRWAGMEPRERVALAHQQGRLMAALHALPLHDAPARLAMDWSALLAEQSAACEQSMREAGVPEPLLQDLAGYLLRARPLLAADDAQVLLHGDFDAVNLLVEQAGGQWRISALLDWGDARIGPRSHELISPGVHSFHGERETLLACYEGYGLSGEQRTSQLQQLVMARAILYYGGEFAHLLSRVPGACTCQSWDEVAACFWHMVQHGNTAPAQPG